MQMRPTGREKKRRSKDAERKKKMPGLPLVSVERFRVLVARHGGGRRFARMVGVTEKAVRYWCDGESAPRADCMLSIMQECGVTSDWLLGQTEVEQPGTAKRLLWSELREALARKLARQVPALIAAGTASDLEFGPLRLRQLEPERVCQLLGLSDQTMRDYVLGELFERHRAVLRAHLRPSSRAVGRQLLRIGSKPTR